MNAFDRCVARLVDVERGFSNRRDDSGGATRWGITEAVARANGYGGIMRELEEHRAFDIYRAQYWNLLQGDAVATTSEAVAYELFESGVNAGIATSAKFLQRALNALNRLQRDYPDVAVDGLIGPQTVYCLKRYMATRGAAAEAVLLKALNCLQGAYYIKLAETREKDEAFLFGWLNQRIELTAPKEGALI